MDKWSIVHDGDSLPMLVRKGDETRIFRVQELISGVWMNPTDVDQVCESLVGGSPEKTAWNDQIAKEHRRG